MNAQIYFIIEPWLS